MENYYNYEDGEIAASSPESHSALYEKLTTTNNRKSYKCLSYRCEKTFRFKSDMERHIIIHSKDRPYICSFPNCSRSFKRPDALKNHLQTHSQDFSFACTVKGCNAQFHKRTSLQYHLLKHNSEKFLCDFPGCQKSFLTYKHLKQHKNTTVYHQKLATYSSSQKEQDLDCFFNHFEEGSHDHETTVPYLSTRNSFTEDFSPKSEKFLHTENGRQACYSKEEACEEKCKGESQDTQNLQFKDFVQLMVCKYLLEENQQMKTKLAIKTNPIKAEYENHLNSMLKKALSFQFDMTTD